MEHQKETTPKARFDIYQQVTETIVQQLENGVIPWQKSWVGSYNSPFAIPKNSTNGNRYKGINILLLWSAAIRHNFPTQEWATFDQWSKNKEFVRKGETGNKIIFFEMKEKDVDGEVKQIPIMKQYTVFNRSQLKSYIPDQEATPNNISLGERSETIDSFIANTKAVIKHGNYDPCYISSADYIRMPFPELFFPSNTSTSMEEYYSTAFHELRHWTEHPSRLDLNMGKKFGDEVYAVNELSAEFAAAFLCAEFGIDNWIKGDQASYIAIWLERLKNNKQCLFQAARGAEKSVTYLHGLQPT